MNRLILSKPGDRQKSSLSSAILSRIVYVAVSVLVAFLSFFVSDRYIPTQLDIIKGFGALSIFIAVVIGSYLFWNYTRGMSSRTRAIKIRRYMLASIACTCILLSIFFYLRERFTIPIRVGDHEVRFLVGYKLTEQAQALSQRFRPSSTEELVMLAGIDNIPLLYGDSYAHTAVAYAIAYTLTLFGLTLNLAGIIKSLELMWEQ